MYVFKNALKNIIRAKGRSILIFILILVVAIAACVALSIKNSAEIARDTSYSSMSITAQISVERNNLMQGGVGDAESMQEIMSLMSESLSSEELETYASSIYVSDFYYSSSLGLSAGDSGITNYSLDTGNYTTAVESSRGMEMGGMSLGTTESDFTLTGYNSHDAMTNFIDGTLVISDGSVFDDDDVVNSCVISNEISLLNELEVGDTFTLVNPLKDDEYIDLTVVGIFTCSSTDIYANEIYVSFSSIESICEYSESVAETYTMEDSFMDEEIELSTAFELILSATYVFDSVDDYDAFCIDVETLGLDTDIYSVSTTDLAEFESSLVPLDNLVDFTMIFFLVVLLIGAIILIVFNLFIIRERKYEIGVLAAIGMPKPKVALQFVSEVIMIAFAAVIVGATVGTIISAPIGEVLLESQIESYTSEYMNVSANFGDNFSGQSMGGMEMMGGMFGTGSVDYVDTLETGMDFLVLLQLMGVGLLLSLISSMVGIISILRYEPLKILSERN